MLIYMQESLINNRHIHTLMVLGPFPLPDPHRRGRLIGYGDRGSKRFAAQPSSDLSKADKHSALHRDITTFGDMETLVTRHRCKQPKTCPTLPP